MSTPENLIDELDRFVWGATAIGRVVNLTRRQTFHALEHGYIDADKVGRKWVSTVRRLRTLKPKSDTGGADAAA